MSLFAPSYYPAFRCIAGDCHHSCCIGWEIDIDPQTLAKYRSMPPKARKQILSHTVTQKGTTSFRLAENDRCPFLTQEGLCQLILTHGEEILCDICREHPRFYNHFSNRTEVGLGLCCEEAARLILTDPQPFSLICLEDMAANNLADPFEADFFATREAIFTTLTNRDLPLQERIDATLQNFSIDRKLIYESDPYWLTVYRNLERLDPAWDTALDAWKQDHPTAMEWNETAVEQLIMYFLYRHLSDAMDDGLYAPRIAFALLSAHMICCIAGANGGELATLIDIARAYSAEVEYNEDAVALLMEQLNS